MTERVFNLYLHIEGEFITGLGAVAHEVGGSDEEKMEFLQRRVERDLAAARRYPVPARYEVVFPSGEVRAGRLPYLGFLQNLMEDVHMHLFREVLLDLAGPASPVACITPVVDGKPTSIVVMYEFK